MAITEKEIYKDLKRAAMAKNNTALSLKEQELTIKEKTAEILGEFDKKSGQPDPKKIKSGLLKKAIELHTEQKNKLSEDLDIMEEYYKLIKNKDIPSSEITLYTSIMDELKEASSEFNELKKKFQDEIDPTVLSIILEIIKEEIKAINDSESDSNPLYPKGHIEFYKKMEEVKELIK